MSSGDSSMPSVVASSRRVLPENMRSVLGESPLRLRGSTGVVSSSSRHRVAAGMMGEEERQVEGLFESLLVESFS